MIVPYGGKLIDHVLSDSTFENRLRETENKKIILNKDDLVNLANLTTGCYSPLTGFMTEEEYLSVLYDVCLPEGLSWTLPIILTISDKEDINPGESLLLLDQQSKTAGLLTVKSTFRIDFKEYTKQIFGTSDEQHPGVQHLYKKNAFCVGGEVFIPESAVPSHRHFNTPKRNRRRLQAGKYKTVTAFSTRNICHIGHKHLHAIALELTDALGINVITGAQVKGHFISDVVFDSYEYLLENYYKPEIVFLNNLRIPPFYAGPKEAFMQALMLQNLGFSHFIVGRDHAGIGGYYPKYASQKIFEELNDLSIRILSISEPRYCNVCERVTTEKGCRHAGRQVRKLNGRDVRKCLLDRRYDDLRNILGPNLQLFITKMFEQRMNREEGHKKDQTYKVFCD